MTSTGTDKSAGAGAQASWALRRLDDYMLGRMMPGHFSRVSLLKPMPRERAAPRRGRYFASLRAQVGVALRMPAAIVFVILWLLGLVVDSQIGTGALDRFLIGLGVALFSSITVWLTPSQTEDSPWVSSRRQSRAVLGWQLVLLCAVVALSVVFALAFHGLVSARWLRAVGLYPVLHALDTFTYSHGWPPLGQAFIYVALPCAALLSLRARPRELGVRRGYRSWRICLLWTFALIPSALAAFARGTFVHLFVWNAFQNGPMEEFLMRGAIMTRIAALWDVGNAVIMSALIFGLWHIPATMPTTGSLAHRLTVAIATCLSDQAVFGIAFGVIFVRTRSLLAGSVIHVMIDAF